MDSTQHEKENEPKIPVGRPIECPTAEQVAGAVKAKNPSEPLDEVEGHGKHWELVTCPFDGSTNSVLVDAEEVRYHQCIYGHIFLY